KVVPQFPLDDVIEVSSCHPPRPRRHRGSGGGCDRCLFCCGLFSSVSAHGSFGGRVSRLYNGDTRVRSCFLPEFLRPTARIATSYNVTLQPLQCHLMPLRDHLRCMGEMGC
ncbi:unnamed protein product, partial [Ixodes pacificus]